MDWSLCFICQTASSEPCKVPLDSLQEGSGLAAYSSFVNNALRFKEHGSMPVEFKFSLDESIVDVFVQNRARWHRKCHMKFSNDKLERLNQKKRKQSFSEVPKRSSKRSKILSTEDHAVCFFCNSVGNDKLHLVTSLTLDENVTRIAEELQDTDLLSKLAGGADMIATDSVYHSKCLTALRTRYRSHIREQNANNSNKDEYNAEARAFVELVSYIEGCVEDGKTIFQLFDLHALYVSRLKNFNMEKEINKTRLKNRILAHFAEDIHEQSIGRNTVLVFNEGLKSLLKEALSTNDLEQEALDLARVSKKIRRDIFEKQEYQFSGNFPAGCQSDSVPSSLLCLVSMLLNGPTITDQETEISQPCLTIAQLILFNAKKGGLSEGKKARHSLKREPPLPVYVGLNVHTQTRSRNLVENLYHLGLSVSYARIDELANSLATSVCDQFKSDGIVCPTNMCSGLFTVGALDNLDHNPSATTAKGSFHGTGISVFQFPTMTNQGSPRESISIEPKNEQRNFTLPENYATVPAISMKETDVNVPKTQRTIKDEDAVVTDAILVEKNWMEHGVDLLSSDLQKDDYISWAAYHASLIQTNADPPNISGLLPLFYEKAATPSMVKHGMDVLRDLTEHLNPGQIPVITVDQPLYAIAKYVQWKWPETHGEKVYVAMLGGLHIEMSLWSLCGDMLDLSGWTTALSESGVASSGTADSFLKVSHLTRTRHAHQITALSLAQLQLDAFNSYSESGGKEEYDIWRSTLMKRSPTFKFWDIILHLQTLILIFIRAHRRGEFQLFVETLEVLAPWYFALDHVNYARWLPIFINDMKCLPQEIHDDLTKFWVVQKTTRNFSSIPIDQAHEQNNAIVKGSGGAVGLTENPTAFARWMVAGPELARILKEFETTFLEEPDHNDHKHHEQGLSTQKVFQSQVQNLRETIDTMGNPFKDDFPELVALDTRNCANESVITTVNTIKEHGETRYKAYVKDVIKERTVSIHNPIKKSSLALFKRQTPKANTKSSKQLAALKSDRSLFSRLYIANQNRDGDLEDFFRHENQQYPPTLSQFGNLRFAKKSDLLPCLEVDSQPDMPKSCDTKVFDGAVVVHALPVLAVSTFAEYADRVFVPYLSSQLQSCSRIDVVWDEYRPESLKEAVRAKRGSGARKKVSEQAKLPRNWNSFLQDPTNKQELFALLTKKVSEFQFPEDKLVVITDGENVSDSGGHTMPKCNHEEADTRLLVHVADALQKGSKTVSVRTVDTDVVVILMGHFYDLLKIYGPCDVWISFGMGKNYRCLHVNSMCQALGEQKAKALLVFHSFTGCDTTSGFHCKGKKTAWNAWKSFPTVTAAFNTIQEDPFHVLEMESEVFSLLERFTVIIYDRSNTSTHVNNARRILFTKHNRALESIPPTQAALLQHARRAVYQASIWSCIESLQTVPSPDSFGWQKTDMSWKPVWSTLPEASKACSELLKCSCKVGCTGRCRCFKSDLKCTELCFCSGGCTNS